MRKKELIFKGKLPGIETSLVPLDCCICGNRVGTIQITSFQKKFYKELGDVVCINCIPSQLAKAEKYAEENNDLGLKERIKRIKEWLNENANPSRRF